MKILITIFFTLALISCNSEFGATCGEDHKAVELARSLTQERLATLYSDIYELRENTKTRIEYSEVGYPIPEKFKDLNAAKIRPTHPHGPQIMLAGCMDEFIFLRFYGASDEKPRIELSWYTGPYTTEKQILWEK